MNITSKSRYAIKIMLDMAFHSQVKQIHRRDIAKRQGVPPDYLDQIINRLRHAGLVKSIRGRGGGYTLATTPDQIDVFQIFSAVEDNVFPVECVGPEVECPFPSSCISYQGWQSIFISVKNALSAIKLSTLASSPTDLHHFCPMAGIRECKPGKVASHTHPHTTQEP